LLNVKLVDASRNQKVNSKIDIILNHEVFRCHLLEQFQYDVFSAASISDSLRQYRCKYSSRSIRLFESSATLISADLKLQLRENREALKL
jgi:hypothetical protein